MFLYTEYQNRKYTKNLAFSFTMHLLLFPGMHMVPLWPWDTQLGHQSGIFFVVSLKTSSFFGGGCSISLNLISSSIHSTHLLDSRTEPLINTFVDGENNV